MAGRKLIIQIPCFDEEQQLPTTLAALPREVEGIDVVEWLIIDDGSRDRTVQVAREHGAEVLSFETNRGLPAVIAAGYRYAADNGYAFCGRVDADGQHRVEDIARLVAALDANDADVAIGSRFLELKSNVPALRRLDPEGLHQARVARVVCVQPFRCFQNC